MSRSQTLKEPASLWSRPCARWCPMALRRPGLGAAILLACSFRSLTSDGHFCPLSHATALSCGKGALGEGLLCRRTVRGRAGDPGFVPWVWQGRGPGNWAACFRTGIPGQIAMEPLLLAVREHQAFGSLGWSPGCACSPLRGVPAQVQDCLFSTCFLVWF